MLNYTKDSQWLPTTHPAQCTNMVQLVKESCPFSLSNKYLDAIWVDKRKYKVSIYTVLALITHYH